MRCVLSLLVLLGGCSDPPAPSTTQSPVPIPTPQPAPPPLDPPAQLAAAGEDPALLCALVLAHPSAPEAQQARAIVERVRVASEARFRSVSTEREVAAPVRAALDAAYARGATDPCDARVAVVVEVPPIRMWQIDPAEHEALGAALAAGLLSPLQELAGPWPELGPEGTPTLTLRTRLMSDGFVRGADGIGYLGTQIEGTLAVSGGDVPAASVSLRPARLPESFVAETAGTCRVATSDHVFCSQSRVLAPAAAAQFARDLHLVAPDPVLAAIPRTLALASAQSADGCAGRVELAARQVTIDPVARTLFADVVDRTYEAQARGEGLWARGRFRVEGGCRGTEVVEEWTLAPSGDGSFAGRLTSTWTLAPACDTPCSVSFDLVARPPRGSRAPPAN